MTVDALASPSLSKPRTPLRVNNFDLIRLLAASQVLVMHMLYYFRLEPTSSLGKFLTVVFLNFPGVPIFFVISGFLVSLSWERSGSPRIYAANRCLRLFPALWICLLATILIMWLSGYLASVTVPPMEFASWVLAQATIGQIYNPDFLDAFGAGPPNASLWSIPVEMQFYIVLPMVYLILPRTRKGFLAGLILIAIASAVASEWLVNTQTKDNPVGFLLLMGTCLPYLYMFLLGVIIQKILPVLMPVLRGMFLPWLAIYVLTVLGMHYWGGWETGVRLGTNNPPIFISIIMAMATISAAFTCPELSNRLLRGNDISYGTYIYHMIFINLVLYLEISDVGWQLTIVIASTYLCGMLSWWLVEKPTLALKQKTLRDTAAPTPPMDQ